MSIECRIHTTAELVDTATGASLTGYIGHKPGDPAKAITCSGGEMGHNRLVVADDYTRVVAWQDGDLGLADFDVLMVKTDAAVLLEFAIDRAGTPTYGVIEIAATNLLHVFTSDDMVNAVLANGSATTMDQIDQIAFKRNVADDAGDASVEYWLVT